MGNVELKGNNSDLFINRELSWLEFNYRVLGEARDKSIPLFDRLKFLSITASNLDEFYMIRVASLKDLVNADYTKTDFAGCSPMDQLLQISKKAHELVATQYNTYNRSLLPLLNQNKIDIISEYEVLTPDQEVYVDEFFQNDVYPVLTPMAVDSSRPFPLIRNKTLNIGALICDKKSPEDYDFATVQVPAVLPRLVKIPSGIPESNVTTFILLEQIIEKNIQKLFLNYNVVVAFAYRIMRNADLTIEEDEAADLLTAIQKQLKKRQWGQVIRLEVEDNMDKHLLKRLKKELKIKEEDIFHIPGPLDLTFLAQLYNLKDFDYLKAVPYTPVLSSSITPEEDIFTQIRRKDILLHHPYHSFHSVVDFVRQASKDPNVLAIKQTLYRVSSNSPIINSLAAAAENGKQVTVLVELKARFDEENNILWAKKLEQSGCHVIYGLRGLKVHSKITLVVRREEDGIRRYVHLGTGNYNDSTAKFYSDLGLLTCLRPIGEDATAVFNMLSGYSEPLHWHKLSVAPYWLRDKLLSLIQRERDHALAGRKAYIIAKMNALCDPRIILALYEASAAGVKIDLIVRGICCLKVGIPKISENITVRSIVGNFLEHSRIFSFCNNGYDEIYLGSADWMPRNLDKRVELLYPLEDESIRAEVSDILLKQLNDNVKAHILQPDGTYEKIDKRGKEVFNSQEYFCKKAIKEARQKGESEINHRFKPLTSPEHDS